MFSSGNEVGTLAVWVGEGGRVVGTARACAEGRGRLGGWPAVHHHHCPPPPPPLFSIGTGARQFVPPPPPERGSPVDDVDAAERTRKTGRGVADGAEMLVQISILRMSTKPQHHTFRYRSVHLPRLGWSISKAFLPAPDGCPNIHDHHALLLELWKEDAVGGVVHPMQDNGHSS